MLSQQAISVAVHSFSFDEKSSDQKIVINFFAAEWGFM